MTTQQKQWWALRGEERERAKAEFEVRLAKLENDRRLNAEANELKRVKRTAETPPKIVELRSHSGRCAYTSGGVIRHWHDEASRRLAHIACLARDPYPLPRNVQAIAPDDGSFLRLRGRDSGREVWLLIPITTTYRNAIREVLRAEREAFTHQPTGDYAGLLKEVLNEP